MSITPNDTEQLEPHFKAVLHTDMQTFEGWLYANSPQRMEWDPDGKGRGVNLVKFAPPVMLNQWEYMIHSAPPIITKKTMATLFEGKGEEAQAFAHFDLVTLASDQLKVVAFLYPRTPFAHDACNKLLRQMEEDYGIPREATGKPIKPFVGASLERLFEYYWACKDAKVRYTLDDVARDTGYSRFTVRRRHALWARVNGKRRS